MASWIERKIFRPIKDAVKAVLGVQDIKEHPYEGQMFYDPFGVDQAKVIPVSLIFTDQQGNIYQTWVKNDKIMDPETGYYVDLDPFLEKNKLSFASNESMDEFLAKRKKQNVYLQYVIIAAVAFVLLSSMNFKLK